MKIHKHLFVSFLMLFGIALSGKANVAPVEAMITSSDIRIGVVRPAWWADAGANQVLRIADTEQILTDNTYASITYFSTESHTVDTYYATIVATGTFQEYATDGVVWYDVPITTIQGKYFDLARLSTTDPATAAVWNKTAAEQYTDGLNHQLWRIWNNGAGVYRPSGASAESRNVSNPVVSSLLYGYLSCSTSLHNGYEAFGDLDENFNLSGRTYVDGTGNDQVLDFIDEADYAAGRGTGVLVNTSAKVDMMETLYNQAHPSGAPSASITNATNDELISIVVITSILVLIAIGYYSISKKFRTQ